MGAMALCRAPSRSPLHDARGSPLWASAPRAQSNDMDFDADALELVRQRDCAIGKLTASESRPGHITGM